MQGAGPWWKAKVGNKTGLIPSNYGKKHVNSSQSENCLELVNGEIIKHLWTLCRILQKLYS